MIVDLKEQMKEQLVQSDRDWKQAALDRENAIREQEVLGHLSKLPSRTPRHQRNPKASLEKENLPTSKPRQGDPKTDQGG